MIISDCVFLKNQSLVSNHDKIAINIEQSDSCFCFSVIVVYLLFCFILSSVNSIDVGQLYYVYVLGIRAYI